MIEVETGPFGRLAGLALVTVLFLSPVAVFAQEGPELPTVPAFATVPVLADTLYFPFEKALLLHLAQEAELARVHVGALPHRVDPLQLHVAEMEGILATTVDAVAAQPNLPDEAPFHDDWFVESEVPDAAHPPAHESTGNGTAVQRSIEPGAVVTRSEGNQVRSQAVAIR